MSNALLTSDIITKFALTEVKNAMVLMQTVDRQLDKQFGEIGDTIGIRKRVRYVSTTNVNITTAINNTTVGKTSVQLDTLRSVPMQFSSKELTLDIFEFNDLYIRPAAIELVQQIENDIATAAKNGLYWYTGTPGTTPSTYAHIAAARTKLNNAAVPMDGNRCMFLEPGAAAAVAGNQISVGTASSAGSGAAGNLPRNRAQMMFDEAYIGKMAGFKMLESQSLPRHTTGTYDQPTSTALVAGTQSTTYAASKNGYTMTLNIDGVTSGSFDMNAGDVFNIAGCYAVNPRTRLSTGQLQDFVLISQSAIIATTRAWVISPAIITSGAYQTCEQAAPNNAAITVKGTSATQYPRNLFWHKDAITLAMAPLDLPAAAVVKSRMSMDGISIRLTSDYNILTTNNIWRLDCLYGIKVQNPSFGGQTTG